MHLFDELPDGVVFVKDGTIEWANQAFWELLGLTRNSIPHKAPISEYLPEARTHLFSPPGLNHVKIAVLETYLQCPNSTSIPVEIHLKDTKDMVVAVIRNLDKRNERKNRAARVERLRALGEIAAGVAHDFNNTLTTIIGRLRTIKKKLSEQESIQEELRIIESAAQSGTDLVMRIKQFSNPAHHAPPRQEVDLRLLLEEAYLFIETRIPEQVTLLKQLNPVPPILANRSELLEVFLNLLTNALDAVEHRGRIHLSCRLRENKVIVDIQDDGIGIPAETQRRIFEPFFSTKDKNGTGLGLSVSQRILHQHNAEIQLSSAPGQGTQFTIAFKIQSRKSPRRQLNQTRLSIVVFDDDINVADMVKDLLEEEGHQVETITDYQAMVDFSFAKAPDLVITDLDLAGASGWDLARTVASRYPQTVVGLMTGWPLDSSEEELRVRGIDFIVNKPFTLHSLHQALEKVGYQPPSS